MEGAIDERSWPLRSRGDHFEFVALFATGLAASGKVDLALSSAADAASGAHLAFVAGGILSLVVVALALFVRKPATASTTPSANQEG